MAGAFGALEGLVVCGALDGGAALGGAGSAVNTFDVNVVTVGGVVAFGAFDAGDADCNAADDAVGAFEGEGRSASGGVVGTVMVWNIKCGYSDVDDGALGHLRVRLALRQAMRVML